MNVTLLILSFLGVCLSGFAADILVIDDFEYPDATAAQQAWNIAEQSDPVELMPHESEGGKTALKMPCPFTREEVNRAVYDMPVELDLLRYGTVIFDFYADDPTPIRGCTIYFHAESGWYGKGFSPAKGWKRVVLSKGAFGKEDDPVGWDKIDGIRICAWKGQEKETFCAVDNLHARSEDVVIIRGTPEGSENRTAQSTAERIGELLSETGIAFGTLTDEDVEAGALEGRKLAIFAYSPGMSDEETTRVEEFVAGGGKIVVFYSVPASIGELLGLATNVYKGTEREGQFAEVAFEPDALMGLPEKMHQGSWNIQAVTPGEHNARAIGYWQDAEGQRGDAAVILSDNGAYMGHILTGDDSEAKKMFVLSLVGHFVPSAWEEAAGYALSGATRIGPFTDRAELEAYLKERSPGAVFEQEVNAKLAEAGGAERAAEAALADKRYTDVLTQASVMRTALADAYQVAHMPRDGEFRAVWNHSGTGDCGTWEDAMRHLADANFNAVVPNMWWGGVAHYDSEFLPHSSTFNEKGDQIAQCVAAGKKYGIEVHPWKVNWNLGRAPEEFVQKLREEGRLQAKSNGDEMKWLCPSHPDNFKLELDTMLEVVRNYDVDGVHFDYIRYPHGDSCYCEGCHKRFEEHLGRKVENWPADCFTGDLKEEYRDWRCEQITRLVRATSEEARKIKPYIKISAAVFGHYPGCRSSVGQDWPLWCEEGWLDFVCPMDYTRSDTDFTSLVKRQMGQVAGAIPLYTGIGAFRIPDDQAIGQMEISRALGADGFIVFVMGQSLAERGFPKFARGITSEKAVLPHNTPTIRFATKFDNDEPIVEIGDDAIDFVVSLESLGAHRKKAIKAEGKVVVEDTDGNRLRELIALPEVGETEGFVVQRLDGIFRISAVGEIVFEDGTRQPFIRRSRPYQFAP